jgi:hypothetical protein
MKANTPNGTERLPAWNITQLAQACREDLTQCTTEGERTNCKAVYSREIRALRDSITNAGRKLTPGEIAVLREWGIATPAEMRQPLPA